MADKSVVEKPETEAERFKRLCEIRLTKAVLALRNLEKLAGYEASKVQKAFAVSVLESAVKRVKHSYEHGLTVQKELIRIPTDAELTEKPKA